MPKLTMPGALLVGDSAGMVDTVALKGVHHCIKSGILAAEAIYERSSAAARLLGLRAAVEDSSIGKELYEVRNTRQPFQKGFLRAGRSSTRRSHQGQLPGRPLAWHRNDDKPMFIGRHRRTLSQAGRQVHVRQALVGLHHRQRDPRRRPNHIRVPEDVPREVAETWAGCARPACTRSPRTRPSTATST
jgi:electron-transferring-flavoprotein dehydrogenase